MWVQSDSSESNNYYEYKYYQCEESFQKSNELQDHILKVSDEKIFIHNYAKNICNKEVSSQKSEK